MLHSGHITFLEQASTYGELYVGIGSDYSITKYKNTPPVCREQERLFMIKAIKHVKDAWINSGEGQIDFEKEITFLMPDIFICNKDQYTKEKESLCNRLDIKLIVLPRTQKQGLPKRSTTKYRELCK